MSLEQALQENTAAIRELIAALGAGSTGKPAAEAAAVDEPKAEKPVETAAVEEPKAERPAKEKKQSAPAATPESKAADVAAADPEPETPAQQDEATAAVVSYDECAASITKLAKGKGRSAAVEVLGKFGLKTLQDAKDKPEVLAKVKAAADTALEG